MSIRYYTSTVVPGKTAAQMQQMLARNGARQVSIQYDDKGGPESIRFVMMVRGRPLRFRLAPDPRGMKKALEEDDDVGGSYETMEQARRTAWRNEQEWLESSLARVRANQARLEQILLGYAEIEGTTMFEYLDQHPNLLPEPRE